LVCFTIILLFTGLTCRLWWIQSVDAAWIISQASGQWELDKTLKQKRGSILDRNNQVLAYEGKAYKVEAKLKPTMVEGTDKTLDDDYVKDPFMTAQVLAGILGATPEELFRYLSNKEAKWVELGKKAQKITEEQKERILDVQYPKDAQGKRSKVNLLPGIKISETTRRIYPNNSFASHVLGYVTIDDQAKMGIEARFDEELAGEPGKLQVIRDAAGYPLPGGVQSYTPAKDGLDVVLTIDQQIQDYVEQELDKVQAAYRPKKMMVLVADPHTGEILAMANRPQFNPNEYWNIKDYTNHAISSSFEPGSTFKIITLAAAIEEKKYKSNEYYVTGSYRKIKGKPINDHNNGHGWGTITFLEGVQRSSNVAFVILGYERLGKALLGHYFDLFGIGKKTGIDLPGESKGIMRDLKKARERDVAVTTFGQGVAVTAIQQMAAVGAIANGGELLKPQIVKEIRNANTGEVVKRFQKEVVRRVVSEQTAKQVRDILRTVVTGEHGTGSTYNLKDYDVAGKTGTAQKYDDNGKIMEGRYLVSFIGFAPTDNPKLLVYVVVDDPETDMPYTMWGKHIISPIFNNVMEKSLKYLQQQPAVVLTPRDVQAVKVKPPAVREKTMPDFVGMGNSTAQMKAKKEGFQVEVMGTGTKIVKQYPEPFEKVAAGSKVVLVTERLVDVTLPDFKGKSLREVLEFTSLVNIQVKVSGSGFVSSQSIPPGTKLVGNEQLQITLTPVDGSSPPADGEAKTEPPDPS